MSTIKPLALYQIETFGSATRHRSPSHDNPGARKPNPAEPPARGRLTGEPHRAGGFLVQLMVGVDPDLRKAIGRREVSEHREAAYAAALANRPSARPLAFLRALGSA